MVVKPVTEYFSAEDNVGTMKNGGVPFFISFQALL